MGKCERLEKIRFDLEAGKLGIARDRLNSLIKDFPGDQSLRVLMGDVNWRLGYPVEAGRYWYLLDNPTEAQSEAILTYTRCQEYSQERVLRGLRLGYEPDNVTKEMIRKRVKTLGAERAGSFGNRLWGIGCAVFVSLVFGLALVGVYTVLLWLTQ